MIPGKISVIFFIFILNFYTVLIAEDKITVVQLINIENSIGQVIPVVTEQPFHKEFSKVPKEVKKKVNKTNKTNRTNRTRKK